MPDQLRASALGCEGNPDVRTPRLDQLAAEGMQFRRTYANVPVCCPSRAVLLTGTYPQVNGMVANDLRLREDATTLAELYAAAGYRTGFVGKWHLDGGPRLPGYVPPGPRRQGFEFWAAYECDHNAYLNPTYFRDTPEPIRIEKYEAEASSDFAIEFIRSQPGDRPFFLTVWLGPPHDPYIVPEKYRGLYDPEKITPPANWLPSPDRKRIKFPGLPPLPPTGSREELATYYAAVTATDEQIGRIIDALRERGFEKDTIILVTSDHGDMLNSHGLRNKRKPHEESARVPGILCWPGHVPAGRQVGALFSHVDMAPTLLALCGLPVPQPMQGADLSPVALGLTTTGPEAVLLQMFMPFTADNVEKRWRGVVTERYTYARFEDGPWLLFDRQTDPAEMNNLVDNAATEPLRQELDVKLAALMRKHGDAWSFGSPEQLEPTGAFVRRVYRSLDEYLSWVRDNPQARSQP